jgi:hypothetical protein
MPSTPGDLDLNEVHPKVGRKKVRLLGCFSMVKFKQAVIEDMRKIRKAIIFILQEY